VIFVVCHAFVELGFAAPKLCFLLGIVRFVIVIRKVGCVTTFAITVLRFLQSILSDSPHAMRLAAMHYLVLWVVVVVFKASYSIRFVIFAGRNISSFSHLRAANVPVCLNEVPSRDYISIAIE
jgi:hypothetical protein